MDGLELRLASVCGREPMDKSAWDRDGGTARQAAAEAAADLNHVRRLKLASLALLGILNQVSLITRTKDGREPCSSYRRDTNSVRGKLRTTPPNPLPPLHLSVPTEDTTGASHLLSAATAFFRAVPPTLPSWRLVGWEGRRRRRRHCAALHSRPRH
jgi:hypothetical protein